MSLIDQAAKRLEELRRAGVAPPQTSAPSHLRQPTAVNPVPTPDAIAGVARALSEPDGPRRDPPTTEAVEARQVELDLAALKARGFITPDARRAQISDEYRVIKRPILRNAFASGHRVPNSNVVMVTSALPREGKTFTSINLAMSLTMEVNTTVLLVDGDVANPSLPGLLDIPSSPGLLELLTQDGMDVNDALVRTNIPNLSVLPAGGKQLRATELLASAQMAKLLHDLSSRYADRVIVFDSPPLLPTTEARVLATHMGQLVMVVAADSTRRNAVKLALSTIESCEIVLMVLNKADKTDMGLYYGYAPDDRLA